MLDTEQDSYKLLQTNLHFRFTNSPMNEPTNIFVMNDICRRRKNSCRS